jgi:hypothetical protein
MAGSTDGVETAVAGRDGAGAGEAVHAEQSVEHDYYAYEPRERG